MDQSLSLYIHFPFCVRKCRYCDFLSGPADSAAREAYLRALEREISLVPQFIGKRPVRTLFFGGGTPSLMEEGQLESLMEALRSEFTIDRDAEISMEVNPGTADLQKLKAFRKLGINRLSIGVQSFHDEELALLPGGELMDDAGKTLLAHAALSLDEHAEAGWSEFHSRLKGVVQGRIVADYIVFVF